MKYQTRANRAEEQVLAMLKSERNIQVPWGLVSYGLENRTLQTTAPEAAIIFNHHASLRPGYEQKEKTVFLPNLFIKLSGTDEDFSVFRNRQELQRRNNCFIFDSFGSFCNDAIKDTSYDRYLKDGSVQKEEFLSSDAFRYSFLRREYQELYVDKVNEILSSRQDFLIGQGLNLSNNEILCNLFQINESFLQAFHEFDFQFQPPSVIINNRGKERPSVKQALALTLLNLLGFDIVIHSPDGYADIENILNPDVFCLFYGDGLKYKRPKRLLFRLRYLAAGAAVIIALSAGLFMLDLLPGNNTIAVQNPPSAPNITQQESQPTPGASQENIGADTTGSDKTVNDTTANDLAVNDTTENDTAPKDTPDIDETASGSNDAANNEPDYSEPLKFTDEALEQAIRKITGKKTEDIFANDISSLSSVRFIGPYFGGPDWVFINGYSPDSYTDVKNTDHSEEGEIKDISLFSQLPGVYQLEVSFQKALDLGSLKGSKITSLTLIHDYISDISPLAGVSGLTSLNVNSNRISDIAPLSKLPLNSLEIRCNSISNIEPLANLKGLKFLNLEANPIKDTAPLYKLTELLWLDLLGVNVNDFGFLKSMTNLDNLNLGRTGLTDCSVLKDLTNLKYLFISDNNISDISDLKNLKVLEFIDISMTNVRDISVLKELPNLRSINMFGVVLDDESVLKELKGVDIRR